MSYVTVHPQSHLFPPHLNVQFFLHITGIQFYKYALGTHQFQWRHHTLSSPFTDNQPTMKAAHNLKQHHSEVKDYSMKVRKCSFSWGSQAPSRWQVGAEVESHCLKELEVSISFCKKDLHHHVMEGRKGKTYHLFTKPLLLFDLLFPLFPRQGKNT